MATTTKNIQIKRYNGTDWVELYPKTRGQLVYNSTGTRALLNTSDKINTAFLPDYLVGQLVYGGTLTVHYNSSASDGKYDKTYLQVNKSAGLFSATTWEAPQGFISTNTYLRVIDSAQGGSTETNVSNIGYANAKNIYFIFKGFDNTPEGADNKTTEFNVFPNSNYPNSGDEYKLNELRVGDWIIASSDGWDKIDNTDAVKTVNNISPVDGNIVITAADIGALTFDKLPNNATESNYGFMSATDKKKLNSISDNANYYILPAASKSALGGIKIGAPFEMDSSDTLNICEANGTTLGAMSAIDFKVLDCLKTTGTIEPTNKTSGALWFQEI